MEKLDNREAYTRGAYADARRASTHTRTQTHFLSPYSSAYGDSVTHFPSLGITGTGAHLPSTHIRNPPMGCIAAVR